MLGHLNSCSNFGKVHMRRAQKGKRIEKMGTLNRGSGLLPICFKVPC